MDSGPVVSDALAMTEPRYAIPLDELVSGARVPISQQVEIQAEPQQPPVGWSTDVLSYGDGMPGDADGD